MIKVRSSTNSTHLFNREGSGKTIRTGGLLVRGRRLGGVRKAGDRWSACGTVCGAGSKRLGLGEGSIFWGRAGGGLARYCYVI